MSATPTRRGSGKAVAREWRHGLLCLALIPLAVMTLHAGRSDVVQRFQRTIREAPDGVEQRVEHALRSPRVTLDLVLAELPDERIEGSYLSRSTYAHWGLAVASAFLFLGALPFLFPWGTSHDRNLLSVSAFTATFGIIALTAFATIASSAYADALDPRSGVFASMFGFTAGVGVCEELTKALPVLVFFLSLRSMDWRRACLWGLASGVGFGVAEGVDYSRHYYNGLATGEIYVVRFVSCVALHAVWASSAAIVLAEHQDALRGARSPGGIAAVLARALAAPAILHGFYDTLLKLDQTGLALLAALGSLAWFATEVRRVEASPLLQAPRLVVPVPGPVRSPVRRSRSPRLAASG
jgi:RsiW-degrading membrane proteinase PrsW (M82 family)